ncbi:MAG: RNA repair domain-containing protein [Minicystis sp.]
MSKREHRDEPDPPREKLRTSEEVYHQIRWDPRLDQAAFTVGYETRDARIEEIAFPLFVPGGEIPWHRIRHYRQGAAIVWDRRERLDLLPRSRPRAAEPETARRPVHRSALAIVPPDEAWPAIQAIRTRYDRHVERWMPHINLLYGFLPEEHFPVAEQAIAAALRERAAFTVTLDDFRRFDHRASSTVWLHPTSDPHGAVEALQAALEALFPACDEQSRISAQGFTPHLSVAQFREAREAEAHVAAWRATFQPITFTVRAVQLLSRRGEEPFAVRASVPLLG